MPKRLKLLLAQINPTVGAIQKNTEKIISIIKNNSSDCDVILFPELALTGYPPGDLLFQALFHQQINEALKKIQNVTTTTYVILGHPEKLNTENNLHNQLRKKAEAEIEQSLDQGKPNPSLNNIDFFHLPYSSQEKCFNTASIFYEKQRIGHYHKQCLPNYGVFDESRYFIPGPATSCILSVNGYRFAIYICEDIWQTEVTKSTNTIQIDGFLCLNASPFDYHKQKIREELLASYSKKGLVTVYVNQVGAQDDLLFDGQSMTFNTKGTLRARAPAFTESLLRIQLTGQEVQGEITPLLDKNQLIYNGLVCALRDYVEKNGFPGVLLGLSGGIDSALTLTIAVDALGASRVHVLKMPSQFTAKMSLEDADQQLKILGVNSSNLPIDPAFKCLLNTLDFHTNIHQPSIVEENIQARIRGILLMAYSNKTGKMVLVTSNKSEIAVGYSTLYGDMVGGYAPLKDLLKTQVYELAFYRNTISQVIPERVITRAPSAELAPNQTDQDSLPPYKILDGIIEAYMTGKKTVDEIVDLGYSAQTVHQILRHIQRNEYKRFQAAPGPKISSKSFGRDWRYPITSGFKI